MKLQRFITSLCAGLIFTLPISQTAIAADPITMGLLFKLGSMLIGVNSLWVSMENASRAEHDSASNSLLKHLEDKAEFRVNGLCVSPDIKNGKVKKGWLVSVEDKRYLHYMVKGEFCAAGGISTKDQYVIGIFTSEYHAKNFATIVKYRTENEVDVSVSNRAVDVPR